MTKSRNPLLLALCLAPFAASASAPEACSLVGEITRNTESASVEGSTVYAFELVIASSTAASAEVADAACAKHVGRRMEIDLTLPTSAGVPKTGDRLGFDRTEVDGVDGYIDYRFVALNPPAQP